jgi:hypothetical protein
MFGQNYATVEYKRHENPAKIMKQNEIDKKKKEGEIILSRL